MAWLQNLAGKAEDLLNKIDKNAATVLNEPNQPETEHGFNNMDQSLTESTNITVFIDDTKLTESEIPELQVEHDRDEIRSLSIDLSINDDEPDFVTDQNVTTEELEKSEEEIKRLELENHELNKQILTLQHQYNELQRELNNLQSQYERAQEGAMQAQTEMEQYKIRSQRILQEKEKIMNVKQETDNDIDAEQKLIYTYNEQLRNDLQFQQDRNNELSMKITGLNKELASLQNQYVTSQYNNQQSVKNLQESLMNERKLRVMSEDDLRLKIKDCEALQMKIGSLQSMIKTNKSEIDNLKSQIKRRNEKNMDDVETRLHSITQTLMLKQNTLETITSERNALRIQLEKLEMSYNQLLNQKQRTFVNISNVNDTDDAKSQVPRLMQVSPLDVGVTRKVKHAYSTLDTISIRTGTFLRRYPLARIFVFCYMILLHIWVLIILCSYVPSGR